MNSIATLIGGEDYFDYYRNHQFYAGVSAENLLPSVDLKIIGNHERHRSMPPGKELDFRLFGWINERRLNPEINEGLLNSVIFEIGYNVQDRNLGFSGCYVWISQKGLIPAVILSALACPGIFRREEMKVKSDKKKAG